MEKKTIVIIDDDEEVCDILSTMLSDDYDCLTFTESNHALDILDSCACDLVITDMIMPGQSGLSVISALKAKHRSMPIIMITGHSNTYNAAQAKNLGAFAVIEKPITCEVLKETVASALKGVMDENSEIEELSLDNVESKIKPKGMKIIAVTETAPLWKVQDVMKNYHVRHIPVTTPSGKPLGIISDRDMMKHSLMSKTGRMFFTKRYARDVMTKDPVTCTSETPLEDIALTMLQLKIDSVLVLEKGIVAGIITSSDFLNIFCESARKLGKNPVSLRKVLGEKKTA